MSGRGLAFPFTPRRAAVAAALAGLAGSALAEGPQDNYWAELEYFLPTISSTARMDFPGTHLRGTEAAF